MGTCGRGARRRGSAAARRRLRLRAVDLLVDAARLSVCGSQMFHSPFLSAKCSRNPGFCALNRAVDAQAQCRSSRESSRSSAGWGGRCRRSARRPRGDSRRRTAGAPSRCGNRTWRRCGRGRGNRLLLRAIDSGARCAQRVRIGIDEAMAGRDVARRTDAHQAETGAAGMRFVDALVQLGQRVADVGEAVQFAAQREFEIFVGEHLKLLEHAVHAALVDGVEPVGRSGDRSESDLVESQIVLQMAVDAADVGDAGGQRDARRDRARAVCRQQCAHLRAR